jgi:hypothetical protein
MERKENIKELVSQMMKEKEMCLGSICHYDSLELDSDVKQKEIYT